MSFPFFLYRRLAKFITCEFSLGTGQKIALQNKYEVASFMDVFCHPFYWQKLHDTSPAQHQKLYTNLQSVGLYPAAPRLTSQSLRDRVYADA